MTSRKPLISASITVRVVDAAEIPLARQREALRSLGDLLLKGVFRMAEDEDNTDERPPSQRSRRPLEC
jgi:hypothetical protein